MYSTTEAELLKALRTVPIIDNHAHPLLKHSALSKHPLLSIATEAHGDALPHSRQSLAHIRAVKQLSSVLGCADQTWDAISQHIGRQREENYDLWIERCMKGIVAVLVDDGLDAVDDAEPFGYFDGFTGGRSRRIVRIEPVAAKLIGDACCDSSDAEEAFDSVFEGFVDFVRSAIQDDDVVGFKSVICYRTGLVIPSGRDLSKARHVFHQIHQEQRRKGAQKFDRLEHAGLNELFVHLLAETIRDHASQSHKKPIQFHTGLGDNDITLTTSSPAHMQNFIRAYPEVPIVLLHAGYPYTRELGYLATMYSNVYADIGEVFPFVSRDGQEGVVRQILELCPHSKILYSTDGHWFPETFYLAVVQGREALENVLVEYVRKGDVTCREAIEVAENIYFENSNKLYGLGLDIREQERRIASSLPFVGMGKAARQEGLEAHQEISPLTFLRRHMEIHDYEPKFLGVYWIDMTATVRMRSIPMKRVLSLLENSNRLSVGITSCLGLTQTDRVAEGVSAMGAYKLHADLTTIKPGPRKGYIHCMGYFTKQDGTELSICPRTTLKRVLNRAKRYGLEFTLGFEIELVMMRSDKEKGLVPIGDGSQAWSTSRAMEHEVVQEVLEEAIATLERAGIDVEMLHPESANGQYEVVLPKKSTLEAVDNLLYARDVLSWHASSKGYRMTLHPKPFAMQAGTATHVHMSISSSKGDSSSSDETTYYEPFYAGVLKHLRAISAFTYSSAASYERVKDGAWAGGTYIAWGTENKETPLRKIRDSHWEVKCMDGLANPYLALSAILSAGVGGFENEEVMTWGDCDKKPPFELSEEERRRLGVVTRFPESLAEALEELEGDGELIEGLGQEVVGVYVAVKRTEGKCMDGMKECERSRWVMERY